MTQRTWIVALMTAVTILVCVGAAAPAELKIGVVDPQKILEGTKRGKKIKGMLADYVQARQKIIQSEEADLKKLEEELGSRASPLSAQSKQDKQQAFQQKVAAYQRRVQELEKEVQAKKQEVLGEFTKSIERAVQEIAEKENILLVLEKGSSNAGALIVYNRDSLDLTAQVIKALDSKGAE